MRGLGAFVVALALALGAPHPEASAGEQAPASTTTTPTVATATAAPDPALDAALRAIEERGRTVTDFRSRFTQEKSVYLLDAPIRSAGRILYRPGRLRWETESPKPSTLVIGAGGMRVHIPELNQVEVYEFSGKDALGAILPLFGQSTADLRRSYDVAFTPPAEAGPDAAEVHALRLTPRSARVRRVIARIDVAIDRGTLLPRRLAYADPSGDVATTAFADFETDVGLTDGDFELWLPEGTKEKKPLGGLPF